MKIWCFDVFSFFKFMYRRIQWNFLNGGMKLTSAKSLVVDASGAGNINVFAYGRVE